MSNELTWKTLTNKDSTIHTLGLYRINESADVIKVFYNNVEIDKYFHTLKDAKIWSEFRHTWDTHVGE